MINFIPKYMTEEGREFKVGFSAGSYGTFAENIGFGFKEGGFDVYAAQSWISSDGYGNHARAQQASYYLNTGFQADEHWSLRLMTNYVDAQTLQPFGSDGNRRPRSGVTADRYDTQTSLTTLTLANNYDNASGYVKFYYNDTNFYLVDEWAAASNFGQTIGQPASVSKQSNNLSGLRARETFSLWEGSELVAGFDLDKTKLSNENSNYIRGQNTTWDFPDQTLFSPYAAASQYFGTEDGFHLIPSAGLRLYRHDLFAHKAAPQAGLVAGFGNTDLNFNYARGVNYPSPVALQGAVNDARFSQLNLGSIRPEVVDHYEIGLTHTWPGLASLSGAWFYDDGKDRNRVYMGAPPFPADSSFFNSAASRFKIKGFELSGTLTPVDDLELFAGATWLTAKARGEDGIEADRLPYTPEFTFQAGFKWDFGDGFRLSGDYQRQQGVYSGTNMRTGPGGANFTPLSDSVKLDNINVVNLRLGYMFNQAPWNLSEAEIFINVNNVLNSDYAYTLDGANEPYKMPGATFMVGAELKF
jgi:iron complex outermembrane receptor protein